VAIAPPTAAPAPSRRPRAAAGILAALVVAAALLRLPALLASRHLGFDDGVYGASAVAMRAGELPFRDVFSSQGPLFLPLVFLADLLGLRTLDAPRLLALVAGAGLVTATWSVGRGLGLSTIGSGMAAALVATSGSVLWVSGPLTSDGPALALATTAVALALAWRKSPSVRLAVLCGLTLGAALSIKSLLVAAAVPVGLILWNHRRHLGMAAAGAVVVGLGSSLPWGLGRVWDQSVTYHLEAAGSRTPLANARKVLSTLGDRDLPLLLAVGAVAVATVVARRRRVTIHAAPIGRVAAWLATTAVVLLLEHPLWRNHVAHLVPPAALLTATLAQALMPHLSERALRRLFLLPLVLALPYHLAHVGEILVPDAPGPAYVAARDDLRALPAGAWAISDEPGVVWRAGRRTPADLVDTSILRIRSGRITTDSLVRAAAEKEVCAVLVWSSARFGSLSDLPARLPGYRLARGYGGPKALYMKDPCTAPGVAASAAGTTTSTAEATTTAPPTAPSTTAPRAAGNAQRFVGVRLPAQGASARQPAPGVVLLAATVVTAPNEFPRDYVAQHVTENGRPMLWMAKYLDAEHLEVVDAITLPAGDVALGRCRMGGRPDRKIVAVLRPKTTAVVAAWRLDPATEKIAAIPTAGVACPPR
jgi:hypothetical protein